MGLDTINDAQDSSGLSMINSAQDSSGLGAFDCTREGNTDDLTDAALDKAGEAGADVEAKCDEGGRCHRQVVSLLYAYSRY